MQRKLATTKKPFQLRNVKRWFKYKYLMLTRAEGGPGLVAMGYSIGLAVEMFTLPTAGLAFFLIFPLIYIFRASMAAALIGFVFGKIIYLPMTYFHLKVGNWLLPHGTRKQLWAFLPDWMDFFVKSNLKLLVGGVVDGIILGILFYFPIKWLLMLYTAKRKQRREAKRANLVNDSN
ncbi:MULTISPECIES: DUF2062 domain-containing protein [Paenibacillus]|jgi:uncharacterized protein (DUF2062 family)|uniref:DUF2062 domain-containing protein n=1 Tax=Paenibacillus baimaensis TaxID=2982185 RepID=A0ABT2UNX5_9BACL|nr:MULTISPECIES: DUF2062 domain-containing protein [unclassified Paenibacillus]MCU6796358.1 DUF2062 domain-containing protein [Paenibacillus sp. WQ 127069]OMF10770.1 hypothetical protein BK127_26590 [Paenibacillus sp. FSL H7-0331]